MLGTPRPWWRSAVFSVTGTSTNETLGYLFARWKKAGVIALHACAKFKGEESAKKLSVRYCVGGLLHPSEENKRICAFRNLYEQVKIQRDANRKN
mmetsp:Transcript_14173/g.20782  ORF Transcript_14173/g.20782 Transcript_14173/m.20782 type:complete len:95 (+) Transcript_14173:265-549(+)